jgi:4,5-dihydroxyphthalate decarboxylase
MNSREQSTLSAMMGTYPKTALLKDASIASKLLRLDYADVDTAQKAFKDVVRREKFDVAELAIVTFLQAFDAGKGYALLPYAMNGHFHHKSILVREDASLTPQTLAGKKVAMRAWSQTTPTWVRGILADDYGVRMQDVHWLSQEEAHVEGYQEPAWVSRMQSERSLEQMLRDGDVDAIIAGGGLSGEPGLRTLIPDPKAAALAWHQRTGAVAVNHVVTVRKEIAAARPDLVRELYRMLLAANGATRDPAQAAGPDLQPAGFAQLAPSLETVIRYAHEQKLISRRFAPEELYGGVLDALA